MLSYFMLLLQFLKFFYRNLQLKMKFYYQHLPEMKISEIQKTFSENIKQCTLSGSQSRGRGKPPLFRPYLNSFVCPKQKTCPFLDGQLYTAGLNCSLSHCFYVQKEYHCVKSVQIRSYFWNVFSCIRAEYRKIRTRSNSIFGHFSRNVPHRNF